MDEDRRRTHSHANIRRGVSKPVLFLIICMVALVSFIAGTREYELRSAFMSVIGVPKSTDTLNATRLQQAYQYLKANFDGKLDAESLVDGASRGMVEAAGDKHTVYLTREEADRLQDDLDGDIGGGIGAEIGLRNGVPTIVRILPGNPAERTGLAKGDTILKINNDDVSKQSVDKVVAKIRGPEGSTVRITVQRGSEQKTVAVERAIVSNPSVRSEIKNGIGIITILRFDNDTGSLARKVAEDFKSKQVSGVILDLRGDGGGYVDGAIDVASLWVEDGVIVSQRKNGKTIDESSAKGVALLDGVKTIVLVDEGTASASEIVSGALRDYGKATLFGVKTYGKGSVQQLLDLDNGAKLKVTIAKWYTPKGHNIDGSGLVPDTTIKITGDDINNDRDPQLDAALKGVK